MALSKIYKSILAKSARRDLAKLEKNLAIRVLKKLHFFMKSEKPIIYAKRLKDKTIADYRFRIGDYRIFFDKTAEGKIIILLIIAVKHRKEAY